MVITFFISQRRCGAFRVSVQGGFMVRDIDGAI